CARVQASYYNFWDYLDSW
nr:immunoglobulin heavy chain junction region [Macaca mulatta]MOW98125.1 immunoglobulin heavy chain junction region [Macaca mulatta]MOW98197.1 immunoglobulin heavy chain junction region [Macaca mulatta]MOW98225.1 immunoglobulin heavy chain junction region [Macaca mulatta]MOW98370.1 immunoglobulin heavy chain junction region [Macaca mulatta]